MTTNQLKSIFENDYNREDWRSALQEIFHIKTLYAIPSPVELGANDFDAEAFELGNFETAEGLQVGLYEVSISPEKRLDRNKVGLRNLMRKVYQNDGDAALIVFTQGHTWRFTYASELTIVNKETGERERKQTDPKKYTYIFGRNQHCRTAAERFKAIKLSVDLLDNHVSLSEIEKAFSVDTLTKDFYRELSNWYFWSLTKIEFPDDAESDKDIRNSTNTIRLITRLIFVWFLKQKKLVPDTLFDKDKIFSMLNFIDKNNSTYYKAILQNLFFATLNQEMEKRTFRKEGQHYNITNLFRYKRYFKNHGSALVELFSYVPFLNGGLFECLDKPHPSDKTPQGFEKIVRIDGFSDRDDNKIHIPDFLFFGGAESVDLSEAYGDTRQRNLKVRGLIDILNSYNFTVEENTPLDIQVALDPELLGKVFENLLASYNPETKTTARKQTGSFYTPREIVHYMVDESLKAYLIGKLTEKLEMSWRVKESNPIDTQIGTTPEIENYIKFQKELLQQKITDLLSYSDADPAFESKEVYCLIAAIDEIKVLDPACGSGAYPMGVLQQLVHLLQKVDPDNRIWKFLQMEKARKELQNTIEGSDADNFATSLKEILEAFENNSNDYGRKLFLIENCIYGVDIQPIAVQIAKLRFFISLICEQDPNPELPNLGIKPLPNLETKFVSANTLIGLDNASTFKPNSVYDLEKQLEDIRHRHFSARTPETKRKYRDRDSSLRNQIANILKEVGFPETSANQIANWNPYDQNASASFFDKYWMFGIEDGFDVVIGNPPYVEAKKLKSVSQLLRKYYITYSGTADLYVYFYENGLINLRSGGTLIFITSNKFIKTSYGENLRKYFTSYKINQIIDFTDIHVFDALVASCVFSITKTKSKENTIQISIADDTIADFNDLRSFISANNFHLSQNILSEKIWQLEDDIKLSLKEKIEVDSTKLNQIETINIFRGITTGFNPAFIIDSETRSELVRNHTKNLEIIKPLLQGRNIRKWFYNRSDEYLLFIPWHFPLQNDKEISGSSKKAEKTFKMEYPYLYEHLSIFKEKLLNRNIEETGIRYEWYALQRCAASYYSEFESEKIVWGLTSDRWTFAYDNKRYFLPSNGYILTSSNLSIKYLLALMNSKLMEFYFIFIGIMTAGGAYTLKQETVSEFPIKMVSRNKQLPFIMLVDKILQAKNENTQADIKDIEKHIDEMVYKLYELNYEEIKVVDPEFWLSEEEYEKVKIE